MTRLHFDATTWYHANFSYSPELNFSMVKTNKKRTNIKHHDKGFLRIGYSLFFSLRPPGQWVASTGKAEKATRRSIEWQRSEGILFEKLSTCFQGPVQSGKKWIANQSIWRDEEKPCGLIHTSHRLPFVQDSLRVSALDWDERSPEKLEASNLQWDDKCLEGNGNLWFL